MILVYFLLQICWCTGFCPDYCRCNDTALSVSCKETGLEILPITLNPGIVKLELQYNKIKVVDAALRFYGQLEYLDLSHNQILRIPERGFKSQKRLTHLILNNNKIALVHNETLQNLGFLTVFSVRKNYLTYLGPGIFWEGNLLQELDLGQNKIATIHSQAFLHLTNLKSLYLDHNYLLNIPTLQLQQVPHLQHLHLGHNVFPSLLEAAFAPVENLETLELQGGQIKAVSPGGFQGLSRLQLLRLEGNRLTRLPCTSLAHLTSLERLHLGHNLYHRVEPDCFESTPDLVVLDLSLGMDHMSVAGGAFSHLENLTWLSLSGTPGLEVEPGALSNLTSLQTLLLVNVSWQHIPPSLHSQLPDQLKFLNLGENVLVCDCSLSDAHSSLAFRLNLTVAAACVAPPELAGTQVTAVAAEQLVCPAARQPAHAALTAVCVAAGLGTGLTVLLLAHCQRKSWPASHISSKRFDSGMLPSPVRSQDFDMDLTTDTDNSGPTADFDDKHDSCDEDLFYTIGRDGKSFQPIRVREL